MRRRDIFIPIVFLSTWALYSFTLAPTVTDGDSGELLETAFRLDVPHPSGYPVHSLLGKAAYGLPLDHRPFGVNLLSPLFGAVSAMLLYLIILYLSRQPNAKPEERETHIWRRLSALAAVALFAGSVSLWKNAVVTEIYTMKLAGFLCVLWTALRFRAGGKSRDLFFMLWVLALALGVFADGVLILPAIIWIILARFRGRPGRWLAALLAAVFILALGSVFYMMYPLRSAVSLPLDWSHPDSFQRFMEFVTARVYAERGSFAVGGSARGILAQSITKFLGMATWLYFIGFICGVWVTVIRSPRIVIPILLGGAMPLVFYGTLSPDPQFFAIPLAAALIFSALGWGWMAGKAGRISKGLSWIPSAAICLGLLVITISWVALGFRQNDRCGDLGVWNKARTRMKIPPQYSVIVTFGMDTTGGITALQDIFGLRPDVVHLRQARFRKDSIRFDRKYISSDEPRLGPISYDLALETVYKDMESGNLNVTANELDAIETRNRCVICIYWYAVARLWGDKRDMFFDYPSERSVLVEKGNWNITKLPDLNLLWVHRRN